MTTVILSVNGMSCLHCVGRVKKAVTALSGVKDVQVDLAAQVATVEYDPQQVSLPAIRDAIADAGYTVEE